MKYKIKVLVVLMLFGITMTKAQNRDIRKGDDKFSELSYIDARKIYLKVAEKGYYSEDLLKRLGDSYYFNADYKGAEKWYGVLYTSFENLDSEYLYRYALSLKSDSKYEASDRVMNAFYESKGKDYRANLFFKERDYLKEIEARSGSFELQKVDFNSKLSDFAPTFYEGSLVFASNRADKGLSRRVHDWNKQPFLDLYRMFIRIEGRKVKGPKKLPSSINTRYHESTAIFTKDGSTMYFSRNNFTDKEYKEDSEGTNRLKLYIAKKNNKQKWSVKEVPINNDEYSIAHPALSPDEKTLYFSSDMPGGNGLSDLYKVSIKSGGFGTPINLGEKINTEGRETFPFVSSEGKLFFASDGHVGLGGLDVFVSEMNKKGEFGEVYNLGEPINSNQDDFTLIINDRTGEGYFASNRKGGVGDDDIYRFKSLTPLKLGCKQSLLGYVLAEESNLPLANTKVYLIDSNGDILGEKLSSTDGSFKFDDLECSSQYSIRAIKREYTTAEHVFTTIEKDDTITEEEIVLKKGQDLGRIVVEKGTDLVNLLGLKPIYFDLGKSFIRQDAEIELQKVIAFLNLYPNLKIDVRSHTDSRSKDSYNMSLSERRAQSTVNYIVNQGGVSRLRIQGSGYGETRLVNRCSNGVPCKEYEHELNRRSEFIVVQ